MLVAKILPPRADKQPHDLDLCVAGPKSSVIKRGQCLSGFVRRENVGRGQRKQAQAREKKVGQFFESLAKIRARSASRDAIRNHKSAITRVMP